MNEEEKKAIELLKGLCSDDCINKDIVDTIVNLINKQQKEIEQFYKEININTEIHKRNERIKELEELNYVLHESDNERLEEFKDKMREFIEKNRKEFGSRYNLLDYDDITYEYWIKADKLIKLLEESEINENN